MKNKINMLSYKLEIEKIIEYMKLSTEEKLMWLEEANRFNQLALSDKEKKIQRKFLGKE